MSEATESREDGGAEEGQPTPGKRSLQRSLVLALVIGVVVFAAMSFYGDVERLKENLTRYRWGYFATGIGLATLNYVFRFGRWEYYLSLLGIAGVPKGESARIFFAGFVMSVTPGKVGEVFKSLLLYEARGISVARTAPIVVAERLTDLMALVILASIGSLAFSDGWAVCVVGAVVVVAIWLACVWQRLGMALLALCERIPVIRRVVPKLRVAYESLQFLVRPLPLVVSTFISVAAWGLEVVSLWIIARGFEGVHLDWLESTFAYSVPTIVGALAMMPGGLGVTEAGMTGVLETVSGGTFDTSIATATTMLVRIATLWWAVALGVMALGWHRRALARAE